MKKHTAMTLFIVCIICLQTVVCIASVKRPAWIENPWSEYPEQKYLVGVGQGDTIDAAKNSALASVSGFFETQVVSSIRSLEKEESLTTGGKNSYKLESSISSDVQIISKGKLQFAEIRETWQDTKAGTWYCLAVLETARLLDMLESTIEKAESQISFLLREQPRIVDRIKDLQQAFNLAEENEINYIYYNALTSGSRPKKHPETSSSIIMEMLAMAKNRFPLRISAQNDDGRVETALREACSKNGLTCKDDSNFLLNIDIKESGITLVNNQYFVKLEATLKLINGEEVWLQIDETARLGDLGLENAKQRTISSLAAKLSKKFLESLGLRQ
ncbi:MAG: hypothetical protein GXY81_00710 [Candidatus Cloacimonetes bacterium]|nr:hypothetical protein [Candidatus Cloacimonadota bacterium]